MLHITNGHSVSLDQTGLPGHIIYWLDVLHEGPVPSGLSLQELSDEVVLWLEHDLYDQLQLVRLLDWFARQEPRHPRLSLICNAGQRHELFPQWHGVSSAEYETAQAAWRAFTSNQPTAIEQLIQDGTEALPLQLARAGLHGFEEMFVADPKLEERIFIGDVIYRRYLQRLREARHPLLQEFATNGSTGLRLTALGRSVLAGEADHVTENGIDTWLGAVHLHDGEPVWRWDGARGTLAS